MLREPTRPISRTSVLEWGERKGEWLRRVAVATPTTYVEDPWPRSERPTTGQRRCEHAKENKEHNTCARKKGSGEDISPPICARLPGRKGSTP